MTITEIISDLREIIQRSDLTDAQAAIACKDAHRSIQRAVMLGPVLIDLNWQCMETSDTVTVAAGANTATLPTDFKQARRLWQTVDSDILQLREATEGEIHRLRQRAQEEPGDPAWSGGDYLQRWWIEGRTLYLAFDPDQDASTEMTLDYFKVLDYPATSDWFTDNIPDVIRKKAEAVAYNMLYEHQLAERCEGMFKEMVVTAYRSDRANKNGAMKVRRPPIASILR